MRNEDNNFFIILQIFACVRVNKKKLKIFGKLKKNCTRETIFGESFYHIIINECFVFRNFGLLTFYGKKNTNGGSRGKIPTDFRFICVLSHIPYKFQSCFPKRFACKFRS